MEGLKQVVEDAEKILKWLEGYWPILLRVISSQSKSSAKVMEDLLKLVQNMENEINR